MPPGDQRGKAGVQSDLWSAEAALPSTRSAPSAMPLNKAATGPKMNGYHGQGAPGVEGPMGRNDGVLYGRMPGGENAAASMWSAHDSMGMRHPGLGNGRMQGMPGLRPSSENAVIHGMDGLQISEGPCPPARTQRQKIGEGERQEETDDDMFAMFRFKVVPCSKQFVHDWKECSFAHEGETARRRHPSLHTATPCPDFKSTKSCPRGERCTMAHGPWEAGLHPDAFKTNLCAYGKGCQRRMCFFAHDGAELRTPQPGASQQLMQQPALPQHGGGGGQGPSALPNQWQGQHHHPQQQQQQHGPGRQYPNYNNASGGMPKAGVGNQRGRSSMGAVQGPKNGMVPGAHDQNLPMGFEDMSVAADRKSVEAGMAGKQWAPVAQGTGAVHGLGNQAQLSAGGLPNQRQAGRGLNPHKGVPNASAASGAPNAVGGPGGKQSNVRRGNNMRGVAVYNAARMANPQQTGAPGAPDGDNDTQLKAIRHPAGDHPQAVEGRGGKLVAGASQSPEWIKQEDTSWVDKLLDSPFDAM